MEPLLPEEAERRLDDVTFELVREASMLAGRMHPLVQDGIGALVRSMNCYYSNPIDGHVTHPRDVDRALIQDFSTEPRKRALQLEAVAHIDVQKRIDLGADLADWPASRSCAQWLHRTFCEWLPDDLQPAPFRGGKRLLSIDFFYFPNVAFPRSGPQGS